MNLSDMTVTELRKLAAELEISGRSKMKKADLIATITRAQMDAKWEAEPQASDHNPVTGEVTAVDITAPAPFDMSRMAVLADTVPQRISVTPVKPTRTKAMITRDVPGAAFFNISDGPSGVIVRYGNVFELVTGSGETITLRARTMVKAIKRLAVKLGIHLDAIDTVKVF
jgi:hypothetical protein